MVCSPPRLLDQLAGLDDLLGVEARRRLVQDQHVRVVEDGLGEADALAVALGELAHDGCAMSAMRAFSITSRSRCGPFGAGRP